MKNIFKSLMFVAVAAMTFTACQKDFDGSLEQNKQNEQNAQGATTITFNADFADDTRSGFAGKEGDAYKSEWHTGDTAKFAVHHEQNVSYQGYDSYWNYTSLSAYVTATLGSVVESTINNNAFEVTFENGPYYYDLIMAFSPAESWNVKEKSISLYDKQGNPSGSYYNQWESAYTIPEPQTPAADSVDPLAHILKAECYYYYDYMDYKLNFAHQVAYGKLTLTNFDETIDNVRVTIGSKTYTLNADNVVNNIFWFGCEANEAPDAVKVVVNTADKSYTKELDLTKGNGNGLPFIKGQVSTFSVDMSTAEEGEVGDDGGNEDTPLVADYIYDTITWNSFSDRFELTDSTGQIAATQLYVNSNDRPGNNSIVAKSYTYAGNAKTYPAEGTFSLRYILGMSAGSHYMVGTSSDAATMVVTYNNGVYTILITIHTAEQGGIAGKTIGFRGTM